tara:strand:- start:9064 stop:9960 length:897 start_codon:yes stop_codon:yes gene_type:complete
VKLTIEQIKKIIREELQETRKEQTALEQWHRLIKNEPEAWKNTKDEFLDMLKNKHYEDFELAIGDYIPVLASIVYDLLNSFEGGGMDDWMFQRLGDEDFLRDFDGGENILNIVGEEGLLFFGRMASEWAIHENEDHKAGLYIYDNVIAENLAELRKLARRGKISAFTRLINENSFLRGFLYIEDIRIRNIRWTGPRGEFKFLKEGLKENNLNFFRNLWHNNGESANWAADNPNHVTTIHGKYMKHSLLTSFNLRDMRDDNKPRDSIWLWWAKMSKKVQTHYAKQKPTLEQIKKTRKGK